MKILATITYYSPYVSGLSLHAKRLSEELIKKGNEVSMLCMKHDKDLPEYEIINGVKIIRAKPMLKIGKGYLSWDWIAKILTNISGVDAVVINLPQAEGWLAGILGKLFGKRVVAVYHCEIEMPNKFIQKLLESFNWISLAISDKIVTYTEDYGKHSRLLRDFSDKTEYIYPPVDVPIKFNLSLKKPEGEVWIGVAARLAREKGIEYLLETIPLLKNKIINFKIVVAGPIDPVGEAGYKSKIIKLVEKYKDRVVFLGSIDPDKMGGFYKKLDVLVLSSVNSTEAFGMVQVEAMMCGVPVIATDLPGVRMPIRETGMGIIVPSKNPGAIAKAISKILKNKNKYTAGKDKAVKLFKISDTVNAFERILK